MQIGGRIEQTIKEKADRLDKMLNVSGETPQRKHVNTDLVKAAVAGDWVTGREPYNQPVKFKPFAKHFFAMNEVPAIDDDSYGMMRRLYFITFPRTFKRDEMDVDLQRKLRNELSGIFNWALEGYRRLSERRFRFTEPASMKQSKRDYSSERNSVSAFLAQVIQKTEKSDGMKFGEVEGYDNAYPKRDFRKRLVSEGYEVRNSSKHDNQLYVFGVGLK